MTIFSLLKAAAKFEQFKINMDLAAEGILTEWAVTVRDKAKEAIGTYKYGWEPLGPAAVAKHGDTPLLDTGELRDSISAFVEMHGVGHRPRCSWAVIYRVAVFRRTR